MTNNILKINNGWRLISGNDDNVNYHQNVISEDKAAIADLPCYTHMYIENHVGISWYQKEFTLDELPLENEVALLCFDRATFRTEVSLNGVMIGTHVGVEDPFYFDVTNALVKGINTITVRISKPHEVEVDGYTFGEIPHRNECVTNIRPGSCYNASGIGGEVTLKYLPKIYIDDIHLIANPKNGEIDVEVTVLSTVSHQRKIELNLNVRRSVDGDVINSVALTGKVKKGENKISAKLNVAQYEIWDINNPVLYSVETELVSNFGKQTLMRKTGYRTFEVKEDGYFYLNDRKIFLRSSHTGNCMPYSTHNISNFDKELLRKDFLLCKASGFNTVRFISGAALPFQLDLCDEIGLMVYEEPYASWQGKNGKHTKELYRHDMLTMVKRDRNHPCLAIWGCLNETYNKDDSTDLFEIGRDILPEIRKLDQTRLVIFSGGRWDNDLKIGSLANPYKDKWECFWNGEGKEHIDIPVEPGYNVVEIGDAHIYGVVPHPKKSVDYIRTIGDGHKRPWFLSEFGIGNILDTISLVNRIKQDNRSDIYPDVKMIYQMNNIFFNELKKYGFDKIYPLASELMMGSLRNHAKYRDSEFSIVRSNPYINGISVTGLLDHSICGEGLFTLFREYKPYIADVLRIGFAPVMWCVIPDETCIYSGDDFKVEVLVSDEEKLEKGKTYPVRAAIMKDGKTITYKEYSFTVDKNKVSFVVPVFADSFSTKDFEEGEYVFKVETDGVDIAGGVRKFYVYHRNTSKTKRSVYCIGIEDTARIENLGFKIVKKYSKNSVVLVGSAKKDNFKKIKRLLDGGANVISLRPLAEEDMSLELLPEERRPVADTYKDWLYHKETVPNYQSPFFKDMPAGTMDVDIYGNLFNNLAFWSEGNQVPDLTHAIAIGTGYCNDNGYTGGYKMGTYNLGDGKLTLSLFKLLETNSPMADKLLINMLDNA